MPSNAIPSPDPAIPARDIADVPAMDYPAHVRTFNAFIGGVKWFAIHLLILLVALYFLAIANQPNVGLFLVLCAIGLLAFVVLRPTVAGHGIVENIRDGAGDEDDETLPSEHRTAA